MEKAERLERHIRVCIQIAGQLFVPPVEPFILPLGPDYAAIMSRLLEKRAVIFEEIKRDLSVLDADQLQQGFRADGYPLSKGAKDLVARHKESVGRAFDRLKIWYLAPLFRTTQLADFDHWGRADFLSIDEIVWLSVGLEPSKELFGAIKPSNDSGNRQRLDSVATYVSRHKEIIRRKFDPHNYDLKLKFSELHAWIKKVNLEVHPDFLRMIEKPHRVSLNSVDTGAAAPTNHEFDSREKTAMAKLVTAMAIDAYGYDPKAKRSAIPNEIQGIADRLGLDLSANTIRKYLRQGAELIPEDWKPE